MTLEEKIKIVQSKGFEFIYSNIDGTFLRNEDHGLSAQILPDISQKYYSITVQIFKYERVNSQLVRKYMNGTIDLFKASDEFFFGYVQATLNKA